MSEFYPFESYVSSVVKPIQKTTREERLQIIKDAKYNLFKIPSDKVMIDLLTDSGTGAISNQQLAEIVTGDESYAGSESFQKMSAVIQDLMGFEYIIPTHQGRAAENVMCSTLIKEGDIIPGNAHFDTTKGHIEFRKAIALDCTIEESKDPSLHHPFKGNVDLKKLEDVFKSHPKEKIPFCSVTITCNSKGGQPVSLENLNAVKDLCKKYDIRLFLDIARYAENAYFIKTREPAYKNHSIKDIIRLIFKNVDGAWMSAKKDAIVAMGGFLALKSEELYQKCSVYSILFEGYLSYGGMTGGTMAALAQGLKESSEFDYLETRIEQVQRFGAKLLQNQIKIVEPTGGHAIYLDALDFFPNIKRQNYPAQVLAVELYIEGGIRGVEIGTVLADRDPITRENRYPEMELVRLAIPRRTYSDNHLQFVCDTLVKIKNKKAPILGLNIIKEPPILRHFTCEFETI